MKNKPARIVLVVLLVCMIGLDLLPSIIGRGFGIILLGVVFAQSILLAVWTAWGRQSTVVRLLAGLGGAALLSLLPFANNFPGTSRSIAVFVQWLVLHLVLSLLRRLFGWRLVPLGTSISKEPAQSQIRILELFAWIAIVASALTIVRSILQEETLYQLRDVVLSELPLWVAAFSLLFALPIIWAAFVRSWVPFWLLLAVCWCLAVLTIEAVPGRGLYLNPQIFWWIKGGQFMTASICLLCIRFSGFRVNATWSLASVDAVQSANGGPNEELIRA